MSVLSQNKLTLVLLFLLLFLNGCASSHISGHSSVEYSPSGQYMAAGMSKAIVIFDTNSWATKNILAIPEKEDERRSKKEMRYGNGDSLVFMGDHRLVTTGFGGLFSVWGIDSGNLLAKFEGDNKNVQGVSVAYSQASQLLAVGSRTGDIYVFSLDGDKLIPSGKLKGHRSMVLDLVFGSKGNFLASTAKTESVLVWDMTTLKLFAKIENSRGIVDLELLGDSNTLIAVGSDLKRWDFMTQEDAGELTDQSMAGQQLGYSAAVAGSILLMVGAIATGVGPVDMPIPGSRITCKRTIAISPDGSLLVDVQPGHFNEKVSVLEIASDETLFQLQSNNRSCDAKFSPDGRQLVIAADQALFVYDTTDWQRTELVVDWLIE